MMMSWSNLNLRIFLNMMVLHSIWTRKSKYWEILNYLRKLKSEEVRMIKITRIWYETSSRSMNRELLISLKTNLETWISEKRWRLMISIWSICLMLVQWSIKLYQRIMVSLLLLIELDVVMLEIKKRISIETLVNCGSPHSGEVKRQRRPKTMCISHIKLVDLHKDHLARENSKRRKM